MLRQFVNREEQRTIFQNMVNRVDTARLLYVYGSEGMGKTWFLERCAAWCSERGLFWRSVDFGPKKPWDYLRVLDEFVPEGAPEAFSPYRHLASRLVSVAQPGWMMPRIGAPLQQSSPRR